MPEIIPAILVKSKKQFYSRLNIAKKLAKTVQIDIMDGLFVNNKTPKALNSGAWFASYIQDYPDNIPNIELHLMVINPWGIIRYWKDFEQVLRIIWHVEIPINHVELIQVVHGFKIQAGLALNPETPLKNITSYINPDGKTKFSEAYCDQITVMGVHPGFSGQEFIKTSLKTISQLRKKFPALPIAVDGGVNLKTAPAIINAGATCLNAAGVIFLSHNPKSVYRNLKSLNLP